MLKADNELLLEYSQQGEETHVPPVTRGGGALHRLLPVIFFPHDGEKLELRSFGGHCIPSFQGSQSLFRVTHLLHSVGGHRIHLHIHEDGLGVILETIVCCFFSALSFWEGGFVQDAVREAGFCAGDVNLT